jgi:hypothetical protein
MYQRIKYDFKQEIIKIKEAGLFKEERVILSDQKPDIKVSYPIGSEPKEVLNFCANNYLGLANHPKLVEAAHETLNKYGLGLASVRFICGTQDLHRQLEKRISEFYETEDTILYSSCFDANGGLFESLLGAEDAIITDALNHASIIDGIRLSKAKRFIYEHSNMDSLEKCLKRAREGMDIWDGPGLAREPVPARNIIIATDGVFSMDGDFANLQEIIRLANEFDALVMVDDSHATGFFGKTNDCILYQQDIHTGFSNFKIQDNLSLRCDGTLESIQIYRLEQDNDNLFDLENAVSHSVYLFNFVCRWLNCLSSLLSHQWDSTTVSISVKMPKNTILFDKHGFVKTEMEIARFNANTEMVAGSVFLNKNTFHSASDLSKQMGRRNACIRYTPRDLMIIKGFLMSIESTAMLADPQMIYDEWTERP